MSQISSGASGVRGIPVVEFSGEIGPYFVEEGLNAADIFWTMGTKGLAEGVVLDFTKTSYCHTQGVLGIVRLIDKIVALPWAVLGLGPGICPNRFASVAAALNKVQKEVQSVRAAS